jgi:hypothetical protein
VGGIRFVDGNHELILAMVKNAGVIWRGTNGYRSQYAEVSAVLTNQPDPYEAILNRYGVLPVRPSSNDDGRPKDKVRLMSSH